MHKIFKKTFKITTNILDEKKLETLKNTGTPTTKRLKLAQP